MLFLPNKVNQTLKPLLPPSSTLLLAISGGPDSVCLLDLLSKLPAKLKFKLLLAHFNHQLRGKESTQDQKFVQQLAEKYHLPLAIGSAKVKAFQQKNKLNLEEAGRILRYEFLEKSRKKYHADFIVTAHHLNDNIETVFLNLIRGASFRGLKGMKIKSEHLLRPLLNITKEEILKYLKKENLKFRIDQTNSDLNFQRNFLRKKIIPALKTINPNFENIFAKFINRNRDLFQFLSGKSQKWLNSNLKNASETRYFFYKNFINQTPLLQKQILSDLYCQLYRSTKDLTEKQLEEILNLIKNNKTGTKKRFGKNYEIQIQYNKIQISNLKSQISNPKSQIQNLKLKIPGTTNFILNGQKYKIHAKFIEIKNSALDTRHSTPVCRQARLIIRHSSSASYKLKAKSFLCSLPPTPYPLPPIFVRSWLPGDKIQPLGMKGYKKLQDIFTDKKIPKNKRQNIPIFVNSQNNILAVGNLTISENHKITPRTKKILQIIIIPLP